MKRYLLLLLLLLPSATIWAQKPVLSAPVARQSGSDIIVDYSIQMEPGVLCDIAIYLSCDGGRNFSNKALQRVSGDVGTIEVSGQKTIVWHVLDEEEALTGENLAFKINVETYWSQQNKGQYGSIKVSSIPAGATIWLDGKNTKKTTPVVLESLEPGRHDIKLVLEGYSNNSAVFAINTQERMDLSLTLKEKESRAPIVKPAPTEKPARAKKDDSVNNTTMAVVSKATGSANGHEWVDLGLSVKWATCNVGASSPSDYGCYFAWGETTEKHSYSISNLRYYSASSNNSGATFSKYNTIGGYGPVDNKSYLDMSDDTARANWGSTWRMPSNSEIMELIEKCIWTWTTLDGKKGYEVKSKTNGNSIFLPAAGYRDEGDLFTAGLHGYYWSSSLYSYIPDYAWLTFFSLSEYDEYYSNRRYGFSVRPVTE